MATDPSSHPHSSRNHARKLTPVIPALPLSLSDKTWRRPSQAPTDNTDLESKPSPASHVPQRNGYLSDEDGISQLGHELGQGLENGAIGSYHQHRQQDVQESGYIKDQNDHAFEIHVLDDTSLHKEQNVQQENETGSDTFTAQAIDDSAASLDHESLKASTKHEHPPQPGLESGEASTIDVGSGEGRRVQLVEEETQPSDHEASSAQPSSTTAITDYGSTTGDSTLETVIDGSHHSRKASGLPNPHRKSEIAPEVLANGFSSYSTRASMDSHHVDAAQILRPKATVLPSIQEHLLYLASTKQFFDTVIYVNHPDQSYQPSEHLTHSLFLSRSEDFAKTLSELDSTSSPKVINLYPSRNILPHAFEAALRFYYSDHVLTTQTLISPGVYQDKQAKAQTFEYVMSYWMAGVELALVPVKARAYEMVQELIDWDNAESVAREIEDLRAAEETLTNNHDKVEVQNIANSLSQLLAQLFATSLDISNFSVNAFAQTAVLPNRFAVLEYPRSNNPALSSMVFGSIATEPTSPPTSASVASIILLNINFWDLGLIAEELIKLQGVPGERVIRQVIEKREEKRDHVINNRAIPNKHRLSNSTAWDAAGWRESVDEHGQLTREKVGFLLPTRNR